MENTYSAHHDGSQWILVREKDSIRKDTKEVVRKEENVGYYSNFHHVISRMYEEMVAEMVEAFDPKEMLVAVNLAKEIHQDLIRRRYDNVPCSREQDINQSEDGLT
jgi:hypothetical protein